jgi:hypothetical protein
LITWLSIAPDGVVEVRVSDGTKEEDQEEEEEKADINLWLYKTG